MNYFVILSLLICFQFNTSYSFSNYKITVRNTHINTNSIIYTKDKSLSELILNNQDQISTLSTIAPKFDNVTILRFILAYPEQTEQVEKAILNTVQWRENSGKIIVDKALEAFNKATINGSWDNEPVYTSAPYFEIIKQFINEKNVLTLTNKDNDLIYIIKSNMINDNLLMSKLNVDQVCLFLAYVKEIHHLVANKYSIQTDRLCKVIFVNDISGVIRPPNPDFSKALSLSSKQYEKYYPMLARETLILNLPFILQTFVSLFKPLFPKSIQNSLIFRRAKFLKNLPELTPLSYDIHTKFMFLDEINSIINN